MGEKEKTEDDKPKPLTADEVKAIFKEEMRGTLQGAVKDHVKRALSGDEFKASLSESMKAALQSMKEEGEGEETETTTEKTPKPRGEGGKFSPEYEARIKAAEKRAERAEKVALDNEKRAKDAEEKKAWQEERTTLSGALTKANIRPEALKSAIALLHTEEKRLVRAEDGSLRFKHGEEEYEVEKGVAEFLKTDGLHFLPPRPAAGSGNTGGGRGGGAPAAGTAASDADIGAWLASPRT